MDSTIPLLILGFVLSGIVLFNIIFLLWMIVHAMNNKELTTLERIGFIILMVLTGIFGAAAYLVTNMGGVKMSKHRKLVRPTKDRMIGGVCIGIAHYFKLDPSLVRILWAAVTLLGGSGILVYIICWIVIPEE